MTDFIGRTDGTLIDFRQTTIEISSIESKIEAKRTQLEVLEDDYEIYEYNDWAAAQLGNKIEEVEQEIQDLMVDVMMKYEFVGIKAPK